MVGTEARPHGRLAPQRALEQFRSDLPWLVAQTASAIQAEVPTYAGRIDGERRSMIETALRFGLRELAEYSAGKARLDIGPASYFKHLGWTEGFHGRTLEALRGAFTVTAREVWAALHRITLEQGLTVLVLGRLGDALFGMSTRLWGQVRMATGLARSPSTTIDTGSKTSLPAICLVMKAWAISKLSLIMLVGNCRQVRS